MGTFTFIIPHSERLGLETHLDVMAYDTKPRVIEVSAYMSGKPLGFVPEFLKHGIIKYIKEHLDCSTIKFITCPQLYN